MAEMNWNEIKSGGSGEGTPFMKLQPGMNQVRIVGLPFEVDIHWEKGTDGSNKRVVCLGVGCPVCKAGHTPTKRFQVLVIDRADGKIKILEAGTSIFRQIKDYALDAEYGNPTMYDMRIKKEGSGRETKYSVVASPNKGQITDEEKKLVDDATSLTDINKPKTVEEIMQMGLEVLDSNNNWAVWNDESQGSGSGSGSGNSSGDSDDWNSL